MQSDQSQRSLERRLLILGPTRRNVALTERLLADAEIECQLCNDMAELCREIERGVGAILLTEEVAQAGADAQLEASLDAQPAWSDLPILLLTAQGADSLTVDRLLQTLGNVSLVERPTRLAALTSTVLSALRAREKQYQIRDYIEALERAGRALIESDQRKDEFLATLAHELRNPLAPIMNAAQLLGVAQPTEATVRWSREVLDRQVRQLTRLVDDLLDISRITRGKVELRRERVDLASIVRSSIETSRPLITAAQHQLEVHLPEAPIELDADPARLAQVFGNLLNNAAKYTPAQGRISISVEKESEREVAVRVRDSGIGIPPEMLSRVFEMFTQVEEALERTQGGLGIGLTLVRRFVELHSGSVSATSAGRDRGSEFVVRLPLPKDGAAAAPGTEGTSDTPAGVMRRIVIVEDNPDGAESLRQLLTAAGHDVFLATDGLRGVDAVSSFKPDVVLMDIGLPGLNGYEAARRIRQTEHGRNVTLIAMTGWGQPDDRRRARHAGFDFHFVKPIDLSAIEKTLRSIHLRRSRDETGPRDPVAFAAERAG